METSGDFRHIYIPGVLALKWYHICGHLDLWITLALIKGKKKKRERISNTASCLLITVTFAYTFNMLCPPIMDSRFFVKY